MEIPEINEFQLQSLKEAAESSCPVYQMVRPNRSDPLDRVERWQKNNDDTDELVKLGLLADVTHEFRKQVEASVKDNGRDFRVFAITDLGRVLFSTTSQLSKLPN
jgi:hypothetical protein